MRLGVLCSAALICALAVIGCTSVTQLRDPKNGKTATCGGEMWNPQAHGGDQHCLDYWKKLGYVPAQ